MDAPSCTERVYALNHAHRRRLLALACLLIICGLLTAGLWPFNPFPLNEVTWLAGQNGLHFGENGTAFSSGPFDGGDPSPCAIEISLRPALEDDANTIVAFYTPDRHVRFSVNQYSDSLALHEDPSPNRSNRSSELWIGHVFRGRKLLSLVVSSDMHETKVYLNGELTRESTTFKLTSSDLAGELVLGTSPVAYATWAGDLLEVAIYRQALQPNEIAETSRVSAASDARRYSPSLTNAAALYRFDEGSGAIAHNLRPGPSLLIPKYFVILHKPLLTPPWEEFHFDLRYLEGLIINIAGFMPLGFAFCAYLKLERQGVDAVLAAILIGAAISLTIEILQGYIPSRASGMTDVITNTTGTALGSALQSSRTFGRLLERIGFAL